MGIVPSERTCMVREHYTVDDSITLEISTTFKLILRTPDHLSVNLKSVQTGKVWMAPVSHNLGNEIVERPVRLTATNRKCLTG